MSGNDSLLIKDFYANEKDSLMLVHPDRGTEPTVATESSAALKASAKQHFLSSQRFRLCGSQLHKFAMAVSQKPGTT